ncbi:MAG: diphosphomevalonate decarboxylase [Gillisia sp.]
MIPSNFIPQTFNNEILSGKITWQAPSNIALVKYWGKKEDQIPANPSISFTLDTSRTTTALEYSKKEQSGREVDFDLYFEGKPKEDFKPKIATFFKRILEYCPYLLDYKLVINTENSFPHSSGIASSASGMSALALCVMSLEKELNPEITEDLFRKKASFLARLGSGSACRSIAGNLVVWGKHKNIENSSDFYGVAYPGEVHPAFKNYQDTILLVDKGTKQVSSSVGHNLMHGHPFAEARFAQAHSNLDALKKIFETGDLNAFIEIVESEALTLHSMMMSSRPYFILMKPNTLEIINKIWEFRQSTGLPVCFTLDAGANVHVLYPEKDKDRIFEFIKNELVAYCENEQYLCDRVGNGATKIDN